MAGSIADFKASFNQDLARPSRFDVNVPIPIGLLPYRGIGRTLSMRCESTELPGRSISTTTMKVYGAEEKYPYQTAYGDISLTFIVGDDMGEKKFFDGWLDWINPTINYNLKYKADYAVPLTINQYTVQNQLSYSVTMLDAFPVAVNQLDLDWSSDGHHKLTVTFAYTSWRNNSVEALGMELLETTIADSLFNSTIQRESLLGRDLIRRPFEAKEDFENRQGFNFDQY